MVIYLDMAFLLNCLSDGAALYVTAQMSGLPVRRRRLLLASAAGGTYGVLCAIPSIRFAASFFPQLAAAALLVRLAFGRQKAFFRHFLLFFMLSCTMGGVLLAAGRLLRENGGLELLGQLNWSVFFLAGGVCFMTLAVLFQGGTRHAAAGHLCRGTVELRGNRAPLTVLLDTGHTLTDGGRPVLTVHYAALDPQGAGGPQPPGGGRSGPVPGAAGGCAFPSPALSGGGGQRRTAAVLPGGAGAAGRTGAGRTDRGVIPHGGLGRRRISWAVGRRKGGKSCCITSNGGCGACCSGWGW